ncbi:hypothetical protein H181DRAFT_05361 [Streptomyces sp. WMMB 714]|jgi:hypothetical protein|uniref:DUF7144 family membrane protein n=1 Tax=Streptomyces sp. WMMB 714 TaxID=1286822 RepID=UPI0005F87CD1|nr:hypothetical protein [Streptomyces sp. WMMB 714]SCK57158.1 hypothetical protein H181DRAFT_05361 [Streptomyces sp. WMMB 714]
MATHAASGGAHSGTAVRHTGKPTTMFSGWTRLAGALMFFGGLLAVSSGVAALREDAVFASTSNYAFDYSLTGWGWVHLFLGAAIAVAGLAVMMTGATWARWIGIVLAGLGMIASFMWLPYFPLWAVITLAIDVFIIWALCAGMNTRSQAST